MAQSLQFRQLITAYLAQRVKGGTAPSTVERCLGDPMDHFDFVEQLSEACYKARTAAKSAVHRWATTGKLPTSCGVPAFVLSNALQTAQESIGKVEPPRRVKTALSGPPWSEAIANEIVEMLFNAAEAKSLEQWIEEEADLAFKSWKQGYREFNYGP